MTELAAAQLQAIRSLGDKVDDLHSGLSRVLTWGFEELAWRLEIQTDVMRQLDRTLKTPSQTQANEWREMAEELRHRGAIDEAIPFFSKALSTNPLDYRIYIGYAYALVMSERPKEAFGILQKSLPHAPVGRIDFRSLSYRLMAYVTSCEGDYSGAVSLGRQALRLSADYTEALYDLAGFSAMLGDTSECITQLESAIRRDPIFWYLSATESHFEPAREGVAALRHTLLTEADQAALEALATANRTFKMTQPVIEEVRLAQSRAGTVSPPPSIAHFEAGLRKLSDAEKTAAERDFKELLSVPNAASQAAQLAESASAAAPAEISGYRASARGNAVASLGRKVGWLPGVVVGAAIGALFAVVTGIFPGIVILLIVGLVFGDKGYEVVWLTWFFLCPIVGGFFGAFIGAEAIGELFRALVAESRLTKRETV